MSRPVTELTLHIPALSELVFRQKMLSDPATMAYNAPWFPPDGCIDFPESVWHEWYTRWIGKEPERFYAYLRRESDGAFVGEVCWHRVPDAEDGRSAWSCSRRTAAKVMGGRGLSCCWIVPSSRTVSPASATRLNPNAPPPTVSIGKRGSGKSTRRTGCSISDLPKRNICTDNGK